MTDWIEKLRGSDEWEAYDRWPLVVDVIEAVEEWSTCELLSVEAVESDLLDALAALRRAVEGE